MIGDVRVIRQASEQADVARYLAAGMLALTTLGLAAGGALHLAGVPGVGDALWLAAGACGLAYAGWAVAEALRRGRAGVDVIALLAVTGTIAVRELLAAAVISVMLASGRALEAWAAGRARRDLRELLARVPRTARRRAGGALQAVPLDAIEPGDLLMVASGEQVPADGMVSTGWAVLDESALTGESLPVERGPGEPVRSGTVNAGSPFDVRVTARPGDSTYAGIVRLVRDAEATQPPFVRLADRYALWFLLVSLAGAGVAWAAAGPARAVAVLVVATPCPLILAAPVARVSGMSVAARRGVVVKGAAVLERLGRCTTLLCDKTGTLTTGRAELAAIIPAGQVPASEVLACAASLDQVSRHVLASAIVRAAAGRGLELSVPAQVEETPGRGIRGTVGGHRVAVGKAEWAGITGSPAWLKSARRRARLDGALTVFVAIDDKPACVLILNDPIRPDARRTIRSLRKGGIRRIVLVTGDRAEAAESVGAVVGADAVLAERSPEEKLEIVRAERRLAPTVMVGDGINDAPALALADVGVALGAAGATASSEAADAVLTVDRIDRLGAASALARRTRGIALQSVIAGIAMSLAAMGVAAAGFLPAVWGALLQEGIDVAVILNALRALHPGPGEARLTPQDAALTQRFHDEHQAIRAATDQLRTAADALDAARPAQAVELARRVHRLLVEQVGPHEAAEERELYPVLDRILGGSDPTGTMSRAHIEIAHQIRRLGRLLGDIGAGSPDQADIADLRSLLYGLHAILRLHTAQEDESYLSLGEESAAPPARGQLPGSGRPPEGSGRETKHP
jgi:heavy metal translocating P-type ATPase